MLEQILEDDAVEARVVERQRLVDVTQGNVAATRRRLRDRVGRAVDSRVVREMLGQPAGAAAHVEQPRGRREMASHVTEVAGLFVPVEVAHGSRD